MLTLRTLLAVVGVMAMAAALDRCGAAERLAGPSIEIAKSDVTDVSARRRKRSGRSRSRRAVVVADPPPGVEYEQPDPDRFLAKPNDPLLTSYWPALEASPAADPLPTAITVPSWPIAPPEPPKEAWAHTSAGKATLVGGTFGLLAALIGYLMWPMAGFGDAFAWAVRKADRF